VGSPKRINYYFFLSYARDMAQEDVDTLFRDLSREVCDRAGVDPGTEVGFLDKRSIEWGSSWPPKLVSALKECKTFVALCTPRYFTSEACGKEWWVYEERLRRYEQERGGNLAMLIPLLWLPIRAMPERARRRQYENSLLDPTYYTDGLRQLIRLKERRDAYLQTIATLAQHIVDQAELHAVPAHKGRAEFEKIPNAFAEDRSSTVDSAAADANPVTSRFVHFVVAAPSRHEVPTIAVQGATREDLRYYGDARPDWAPYRRADAAPLDPAFNQAIAEAARAIATEQQFDSLVTSIDGLPERIESAKQNNQLVVFIVDAWATGLRDHRHALVQCDLWQSADERNQAPAVLVPSSSDDDETQRHWARLSQELRLVFVNCFAHRDVRMFRPSVLSLDSFQADLRVALKVAQNRMYVLGTPRTDVPGSAGLSQPMLNLPDAP
jgi:FxsC-like protein